MFATSSEPSGSFGALATKTFRPGLRSALLPATVVAMMVFGVTRIFFTSVLSGGILYSTVSTWPSTAATEVCIAPLVMNEPGVRSQSPWKELNGPGGKIRSSTASSVPSARGRDVIATLVDALTSASEALTTPRTLALSFSTSLRLAPSRDFTITVLPSTLSIAPRTRTFCACAATVVTANAAVTAAAVRMRVAIFMSSLLPLVPLLRFPALPNSLLLASSQESPCSLSVANATDIGHAHQDHVTTRGVQHRQSCHIGGATSRPKVTVGASI